MRSAAAAVPFVAAAAACAATLLAPPARAQNGAVVRVPGPTRPGATDPAPGVYRAPVRGAVPVHFELRGAGAEPIGVTGDTEDDAATSRFTPACITPCMLWFAPGPHRVQLGNSPIRLRVMDLAIDRRPVTVRFTRDSFGGVATGMALMGIGIVGLLMGIPSAIDQPAQQAIWWAVAGVGLAHVAGGFALTWLTLGRSDANVGAPATAGVALTARTP